MAMIGDFKVKVRLVPDKQTMEVVLKLLDIWQDDNPDMMVALVPGKDRYVYEIVDRKTEGL